MESFATFLLAFGLLAALQLAGLLLVANLVRRRLEGLERRVGEMARRQDEVARRLAERAEEERTDRGPEDVPFPTEAAEALDRAVRRSIGDLGERVREVAEGFVSYADELRGLRREMDALLEARRIDAVERRLLALGYRSVRVTGPVEGDLQNRARIPVEAIRDGITFRGHVTVEGGRVVEETLNSSYEVFP